MVSALRDLRATLPRGTTLSDAAWRPRHKAILWILWLHVIGIPVFAVARHETLRHGLFEAAFVAVAAAVATSARAPRRIRMSAATLGLLTSSAVITHLSGGTIEAHFHFFVMVPVIALYQDWFPFLLAIGYVLAHHGLMGAIDPESVYNHGAALAHPWRWAGIHATFIAGISAVCLVTWRLNELALEERRRAEDEMHHTLSVLTATLESTADGILVVTASGEMSSYNRRFLEMWRIPAELAENMDRPAVLACALGQLADPEAFTTRLEQLYSQPEAVSVDEIELADGRVFERHSSPHRVDGVAVGRVFSFRDMTAHKQSKAALLDAVERLEARDEAKNVFLNAVSHELRTPLASVLGFSRTLVSRDEMLTPARRRDFVSRIAKSAERLESLLKDLLDVDRLSRGILEPRRRLTDLGQLTAGVVESMEIGSHPIELRFHPVAVTVDPAMVERIIENLVANAVKHTSGGTPIEVSVERAEGGARITVRDYGRGVPDDMREAIFEPFRQGETPSHSPGTGIGLALVGKFAALHGGRAWVEEAEGGGAEFHVMLPEPIYAATA